MDPICVLDAYGREATCEEQFKKWMLIYDELQTWGEEEAERCKMLKARMCKAYELYLQQKEHVFHPLYDPDGFDFIVEQDMEDNKVLDGAFAFGCDEHCYLAQKHFTMREKALLQLGLSHLVTAEPLPEESFDLNIRKGFLAEQQGDLPGAVAAFAKAPQVQAVTEHLAMCKEKMRLRGEEYYAQAKEYMAVADWKSLYWPLLQAAEHKITDAMVDMGLAELYGDFDFCFDREAGVRRLHEAAELGNLRAAYALVEAFDNGNWLVESAEAKVWCEKAAQAGNPQAKLRLEEGFDPRPNILILYDKAHEGDPEAQWEIAKECADEDEQLDWILKSANGGYVPALMYLADTLIRSGEPEEAKMYLEGAADKGHTRAMLMLGDLCRKDTKEHFWQTALKEEAPTIPVRQQHMQQLEWYLRAAEAGARDAMHGLCTAYMQGYPVAKNEEKAYFWASRGAGAGDPTCRYQAGWLLENGCGTEKDIPAAVKLYEQAAEAGVAAAMGRLYEIYRDGAEGIPADPNKAGRYLWMTGVGHS